MGETPFESRDSISSCIVRKVGGDRLYRIDPLLALGDGKRRTKVRYGSTKGGQRFEHW